MDWSLVRGHYKRLFEDARRRGLTQVAVAARGGLAQGQISKLFNPSKSGPSVDVFLRALLGLGLQPSDFFRHVEEQSQKTALQTHSDEVKNSSRTQGREATDVSGELSAASEIASLRSQVNHLAFQVQLLSDELAAITATQEHAVERVDGDRSHSSSGKSLRPRHARKAR